MNDSIFDALTNNFGFTTVEIEEGGLGQGQTRRLKVVADGQKYMAKHLASDITPDFECEFLQFIGKNGVPVAKNILTKNCEPFVVCDKLPLVLYEWADGGISWPTKPELAALLGKAIARMHLVSGAMPPVSNTVVYSADRLINRPLRLLEPYSNDKSMFRRLVDLSANLMRKVEEVPIIAPFFGPIHGDIHQGNCLFSEEGALKLLDFSLAGVGYRAYDFAGFLWPMRDDTIRDPAMSECCQSFLTGYESVRSLHPTERDAIQAFIQIRSLWESGDWLDTGTGRQNPEAVSNIARNLVTQFEISLNSL